MNTVQSPDVQTLKRRLIENAMSRQGAAKNSFMHNTQPESALKKHLGEDSIPQSSNAEDNTRKSTQHRRN